jgi:CDGSH-type Zn-finger protein
MGRVLHRTSLIRAKPDAARRVCTLGAVTDEPRIRVIRGGPLVVSGGVRLYRLEKVDRGLQTKSSWRPGTAVETTEPYSLCRCGNSANKPFSDASHPSVCRVDDPEGFRTEPLPVSWTIEEAEPPLIALKPNGPIRVWGVPLEANDGEQLAGAARYSLCRCGSSAAMPFCDGSHKIVGFRD